MIGEWTLAWVWTIVRNGYDPTSTCLPPGSACDVVGTRTIREWRKEIERKTRSKRSPSVLRVLLRVIRWELLLGTTIGVLQGLLATVARPLLLKFAVEAIVDEDSGNELPLLIVLLGAEQIVEGACAAVSRHALLDRASSSFFAACACLIHDKSARVLATTTSEAALIGNDVVRTHENCKYMQLLPTSLSSLIGGIVVLYVVTGTAGLIGLTASACILALNAYIATLAKRAEEDNLASADKRLTLTRRVIEGIKAIKLSAWEPKFEEAVADSRAEECGPLYRFRFLLQTSVQLGRASPIVASCVCFIAYTTLFDKALRASDTFAALNVFLSLRLPLIIVPECVTYFAAVSVSLNRIQRYLLAPDAPSRRTVNENVVETKTKKELVCEWPKTKTTTTTTTTSTDDTIAAVVEKSATVAIEMTKKKTVVKRRPFALRLPAEGFALVPGRRTAVVGDVGSGKTAFLLSLLGEMSGDDAMRAMWTRTKTTHTFGYCPQQSFVLSGTVRENVVVGRTFDADRYDRTLDSTTLRKDLKHFPKRDRTRVGERGVTLSGGQRSRLGLARAVYARPSVLLLDDPLSAVDAVVAKTIFERCVLNATTTVSGEETRATVVMALNQLHLLSHFDEVIVMQKGRIVERGDPRLPGPVLKSMLAEDDDHVGEMSSDHTVTAATKTAREAKRARTPSETEDDTKGVDEDKDNDLVAKQHLDTGGFSAGIFDQYVRGMGRAYCFAAVCMTLATYALMTFTDRWLASWVEWEETHPGEAFPLHYPIVYASSCLTFVCLLVLSSQMFATAGVRASKHLHERCIGRLLRAPVAWFERTPSGRILSRFSSDLSMVDLNLPRFFDNFTQFAATLLALIAMVCVLVPTMIPVFFFAILIFGVEVVYVNRATRDVKRETNNAMSPVLTLSSDQAIGRAVIRASNLEAFFDRSFRRSVDAFNNHSYAALSITTWAQLISYVLSFLISMSTAAFLVSRRDDYDGSVAALAMTYAFLIPYFLLHMVFIINQLNVALTSLERLLRYSADAVPQEPAWRLPDDPPPNAFPTKGEIVFHKASLRYREGLKLSLKSVDVHIKGGEHVGIVGRTGAGKSSLLVLLSRIVDACEGHVTIDGRDVSTMGLLAVRQAFAIVPQHPLLIRGSVRTNLDPFGTYADADLRDVMRQVGLSSKKLDDADDASTSLSAGERQMISLARALLWNRKIVVCDEPTSNVDQRNDRKIQDVLRRELTKRQCTVLTIAHRLATVCDHDRILVMDAGRVLEFDTPVALLENSSSRLYAMAMSAGGPNMVRELLALASKGRSSGGSRR